MNTKNYFLDQSRAIIEISGKDNISFIEGIITNTLCNQGEVKYSLVLSTEGKILFECFLFFINKKIYIDISKNSSEKFLSLLKKYKFFEDVNFTYGNNISVLISVDSTSTEPPTLTKIIASAQDPRSEKIGNRSYIENTIYKEKNAQCKKIYEKYLMQKITNKVVDVEGDLEYGKIFPSDVGLDKDWAICRNKKCYFGQEQVTKIRFMKLSKKDIFLIEKLCSQSDWPEKGSEILSTTKKTIGKMCGKFNNLGLAIINKEKLAMEESKRLFTKDNVELNIKY